jgi:hypothetical protein
VRRKENFELKIFLGGRGMHVSMNLSIGNLRTSKISK